MDVGGTVVSSMVPYSYVKEYVAFFRSVEALCSLHKLYIQLSTMYYLFTKLLIGDQ